jgi:hypothetical protein
MRRAGTSEDRFSERELASTTPTTAASGRIPQARRIPTPDEKDPAMTEQEHLTEQEQRALDELGPVDFLVIEFPAGQSNFSGEMAQELVNLVHAGTIRVVDAIILAKDEAGTVEAMELSDVGDLAGLVEIEAQLAELLASDDVDRLAASMEPGSVAGVLVYENLWAAPFAAAARRAGGQLIASGRIPIQAIIASLEADGALQKTGA